MFVETVLRSSRPYEFHVAGVQDTTTLRASIIGPHHGSKHSPKSAVKAVATLLYMAYKILAFSEAHPFDSTGFAAVKLLPGYIHGSFQHIDVVHPLTGIQEVRVGHHLLSLS